MEPCTPDGKLKNGKFLTTEDVTADATVKDSPYMFSKVARCPNSLLCFHRLQMLCTVPHSAQVIAVFDKAKNTPSNPAGSETTTRSHVCKRWQKGCLCILSLSLSLVCARV